MSAVIESIEQGITRADEGVPLGLINYMVENRRQQPAYKVRVGSEIGYLWFSFKLTHLMTKMHIWER